MAPTNHPGSILPQDTAPGDIADEVLTAQPVTQTEIDDLLYGEDRPASERLERLREIEGEMLARRGGEVADNDTMMLLDSIQDAIDRLGGSADRDPDLEMDTTTMADDPYAHRETLAPDSDEMDEVRERDAEALDEEDDGNEVLDETEWEDEDGFDPEQGVR